MEDAENVLVAAIRSFHLSFKIILAFLTTLFVLFFPLNRLPFFHLLKSPATAGPDNSPRLQQTQHPQRPTGRRYHPKTREKQKAQKKRSAKMSSSLMDTPNRENVPMNPLEPEPANVKSPEVDKPTPIKDESVKPKDKPVSIQHGSAKVKDKPVPVKSEPLGSKDDTSGPVESVSVSPKSANTVHLKSGIHEFVKIGSANTGFQTKANDAEFADPDDKTKPDNQVDGSLYVESESGKPEDKVSSHEHVSIQPSSANPGVQSMSGNAEPVDLDKSKSDNQMDESLATERQSVDPENKPEDKPEDKVTSVEHVPIKPESANDIQSKSEEHMSPKPRSDNAGVQSMSGHDELVSLDKSELDDQMDKSLSVEHESVTPEDKPDDKVASLEDVSTKPKSTNAIQYMPDDHDQANRNKSNVPEDKLKSVKSEDEPKGEPENRVTFRDYVFVELNFAKNAQMTSSDCKHVEASSTNAGSQAKPDESEPVKPEVELEGEPHGEPEDESKDTSQSVMHNASAQVFPGDLPMTSEPQLPEGWLVDSNEAAIPFPVLEPELAKREYPVVPWDGEISWAFEGSSVFRSRWEEERAFTMHGNVFPGRPLKEHWLPQYGLRYIPHAGETNVYRTVLIEKLTERTSLNDVLEVVPGTIYYAEIGETETMTGYKTAFVVFVEERYARFFVHIAKNGLKIGSVLARVTLANTPTYPFSAEVERWVERGLGRTLILTSVQACTREKLIILLGGSQLALRVEYITSGPMHGQITIHFYTIESAMRACEALREKRRQQNEPGLENCGLGVVKKMGYWGPQSIEMVTHPA